MMDISRIAQAALASADTLLPRWLSGGRWEGAEWRCGDLSGAPGKSCAVNAKTGRWSDFQSGESGGDLVALYAAMHSVSQLEAARSVADEVGLPVDEKPTRRRTPRAAKPAATPKAPTPRTDWVPVLPVPADAGPAPVAHIKRGRPAMTWAYRDAAGQLLGYVCRFVTSDGGKEVLPLSWCAHPSGAHEWRWISFPEPRPLYLAAWRLERERLPPVLVVEGEKCADAAAAELGATLDVVSWPGGGKAVLKADWSPLRGRRVIVWPDADAKLGRDGALLPASQQPGISTMRKLGAHLVGLGCEVREVTLPAPGERPDGWDVADAVAEGLTGPALREWLLERLVPLPGLSGPAVPPQDPPRAPPADGGPPDDGRWAHALIRDRRGELVDCRENVMLILTHHPDWQGAVGFNRFASRTESLRETPWRTGPGEWTTADDREMGLWLAQHLGLLIRAEANLNAGVEMAAERSAFHPVMRYLDALVWDGVDRLSFWLHECCGATDTPYARMAGAFFLRAMCARVWKPGAQVDHMLVLEGGQGKGKSTALRVLGGEWYSDTQFRLGDKDALLQLADTWLYEVSELDSFSRADVTSVKQFLTTLNDNIRGVYERRVRKRPRQVVMAGTTNQKRYLRDMTGNRRFWPVPVGEVVDVERLRQWRDQLFAQAYAEVRAGERWWPTRAEEAEHFQPQQDARIVADPWLDELPKRVSEAKFMDRSSFTTAEILGVLGVSADKIDGAGQMARRVEAIMMTLGWSHVRERRSDGTRPWVYRRPSTPAAPADESVEVPL
jgi:predicted P-loop ATPase